MKSSSNSGSLWQLGLQSGSLKALAIGRILWSLFQFRNTFSMLERAQELTKFPSFFFKPIALMKIMSFGMPLIDPTHSIGWLLPIILSLSGIGSVLGFKTRKSIFVFAFTQTLIVSYCYSFGDYHHDQALPILAGFLLSLTPCGDTFSMDQFLKNIHQHPTRGHLRTNSFGWFFVFIYSFLSVIYLSSGLAKLSHSSTDWLSGKALMFHIQQDALINARPIGIWVSNDLILCMVLAWGTLSFQLLFGLGLFNKKLQWVLVTTAIVFHLISDLLMKASFLGFIGVLSFLLPWNRITNKVGIVKKSSQLEKTRLRKR